MSNMLLGIRLLEENRRFHHFVWNELRDVLPKTYQFKSHLFGNVGSPVVANSVVREHAQHNKARCPKAWATVHCSTLVDDALDSAHSAQEAREIVEQLVDLYKDAGMSLHKLASSHREVLEGMPVEEIAPSVDVFHFDSSDPST